VTYIEILNGVSGYWRVLGHVLSHGQKRSPRGRDTLDAGQLSVVMHDTRGALPLGVGRNLSRSIAAAEAVQLVGAFSDPALLTRASANFAKFLEPDTGRFHGAYGERIGNQLSQAVTKLRRDRDTRQATITLWDPWRDNQPDRRDYPCTVALVFGVGGDRLDLSVFMRSQDVWWGAPYDWFQFSQLQRTVAQTLGVQPGRYIHTSVSTHIYLEFTEAAEAVIATDPPLPTDRTFQPDCIGRPGDDLGVTQARARTLGYGHEPAELTDSERWYQDALASVVG